MLIDIVRIVCQMKVSLTKPWRSSRNKYCRGMWIFKVENEAESRRVSRNCYFHWWDFSWCVKVYVSDLLAIGVSKRWSVEKKQNKFRESLEISRLTLFDLDANITATTSQGWNRNVKFLGELMTLRMAEYSMGKVRETKRSTTLKRVSGDKTNLGITWRAVNRWKRNLQIFMPSEISCCRELRHWGKLLARRRRKRKKKKCILVGSQVGGVNFVIPGTLPRYP